jgi:hypothetical protein
LGQEGPARLREAPAEALDAKQGGVHSWIGLVEKEKIRRSGFFGGQ